MGVSQVEVEPTMETQSLEGGEGCGIKGCVTVETLPQTAISGSICFLLPVSL